MAPRTPEQDFVRYRDAGDLAALAAVFDAVADQLLLVAGHLVRDGATAEDLVQTTFVEAMRHAARFDARKSLLPWLARILTNHARMLHRRDRRRERLPVPAARSERSAADVVTDREAVAAIEAGLAELPVHYSRVLTLRLVHDLSPAAIAHALRCPPETVKTRLKRGLEQLRRHLPAGLATSLALLLASGRGLAAVRADVLRHAQHLAGKTVGGGAAAVALALGGFAMKQFLLRATAIVAVLALGWWGVTTLPSLASTPVDARDRAELVVANANANDAAVPSEPLEREVVAALAPTPDEIVFSGRCIAAPGRAPLPGIVAAVWREPPVVLAANERREGDLLARVVSGADGVFRCACPRADGASYSLRVGGDQHVPRTRSFGPYAAPRVVDVGDVVLRDGILLTVRVVDRAGATVPRMWFTARHGHWTEIDEPLPERLGVSGRCDAGGRLTLPYAVLPGRYSVAWEESWFLPVERQHSWLAVAATPAVQEVVLVWPIEHVAQGIEGVVVDESGAPVPKLDLCAEGGGTRGNAESRADGRFVMPRVGPFEPEQRGPVVFALPRATEGFELAGDAAARWGDRDVRIVVRRAATLTVRPIDPRTGEPPAEFTIAAAAWLGDDRADPTIVKWPALERLPDGSVRVPLARCEHFVQVFPKDEALMPSRRIGWAPRDGDQLVVPLAVAARAVVRVVTEDGLPVAGSDVCTLLPIEGNVDGVPAGGWRELHGAASGDVALDPTTRWLRHGIDDAPLARGTTDAEGRVALRTPTDDDVVISALGPGHVPKTVVGRPVAAGEIELRVSLGASVRVDVTPDDVAAALAPSPRSRDLAALGAKDPIVRGVQLTVARARSEQSPERWQEPVRVDPGAHGEFRCTGLPPGTYELSLSGPRRASSPRGILVWWPLGSVTLRDGEEKVVPVDASRWRTGRLRGRVLVNGEPWAFRDASLHGGSAEEGKGTVHVLTDAAGEFDVETLVGQHRLRLMYRHSDNMGYWFAAELPTVVAGATTDVVFTARFVTARARIVDANGAPAAGLTVTMDCTAEPKGWQRWTTDPDGWITIEQAPQVPFKLIVANPDGPARAGRRITSSGDVVLGPFQVAPTGDTAEFRAVLPEGWR